MAYPFGTPGKIAAAPSNAAQFGQGVAYPPQYDTSGRLVLSVGLQCVKDAVASIMRTAPGERPMQADYGCNRFVFEPAVPERATVYVGQNIREHEPRIAAVNVEAQQVGTDAPEISVSFRPTGAATSTTLTFPFFKGP